MLPASGQGDRPAVNDVSLSAIAKERPLWLIVDEEFSGLIGLATAVSSRDSSSMELMLLAMDEPLWTFTGTSKQLGEAE
jgi:hypothetical protein